MPSCCGLFFVGFRKRLSGSILHRLCPLWKSAGAMRCEAVDMSHSRRDNIYTIKYCTRKPKSKKNWESSTIGRERIGQRALICFAMHAMRPWARSCRCWCHTIALHAWWGCLTHTGSSCTVCVIQASSLWTAPSGLTNHALNLLAFCCSLDGKGGER